MIYPNGTLFPDDELSPVNSDPIKYPTEYWYPEYLENYWSEYIDTGYQPDNETGVYMSVSNFRRITSSQSDINFCGCRIASSQRFVFNFTNNKIGYGFNDYVVTSQDISKNMELYLNFKNDRKFKCNDYEQSLTSSISSTIPFSYYVFQQNESGVPTGSGMILYRVHKLIITQGSQLVREFIPAVRKSDLKPGLFELSEQRFYTDSSTGGTLLFGSFKVTHSIPTNNPGLTFYRFKATNSEESVYSNTFYVNVIDTEFTNLQTNYNLFVGDSITINAPAETNEGAIGYIWYKSIDRNNWEEVSDTSSITYIAEQEEMIYLKCKAKNSITGREIETDIITIFVKDVEEGVIEGRALL